MLKTMPPTSFSATQMQTETQAHPLLHTRQLGKRVAHVGQGDDAYLDILTEINFAVFAGESVAIVGASGSGKSTLLGLLAGLDAPTTGKVYWQDQMISDLDEDARAMWRAAHIGFVFQSFQLLGHLTALENVLLPLELNPQPRGSNLSLNNAHALEQAKQMLARVGLSERLHHFPKQLSGGEQQRVALARAFITAPALLFADEPTGSLDSQAGEKMMALLFKLNREQGSTLILVTHDPALAARCDRTIRLQAGRIQTS